MNTRKPRWLCEPPKSTPKPRVLLVNTNGSGMGHLNRCLAYARALRDDVVPVFLTLSSAVEVVEEWGFEADYFVSPFWSYSSASAWNRELAVRMGMLLETVTPEVVVFDGTWPFQGVVEACRRYADTRFVWSRRGLHRGDAEKPAVDERGYDLVIEPGEIGARYSIERHGMPGRKVTVPPVTVLRDEELLSRSEARQALGLDSDRRYALVSLGSGNLADAGAIGQGLVSELRSRDYSVVWARAPISVRDVTLPTDVVSVSVYPLVRYMRAFDVFVGAAGYNTCCEVLQSGRPSLLVPNTRLTTDDQLRRANLLAQHASVVVSRCETTEERRRAVAGLLGLSGRCARSGAPFDLGGTRAAADEVLGLIGARQRK